MRILKIFEIAAFIGLMGGISGVAITCLILKSVVLSMILITIAFVSFMFLNYLYG